MAGASSRPDPKPKEPGEIATDTWVLTDFEGVNQQSPRMAIGNNQFSWLENLIPIGPGKLNPILAPGAAIITLAESGNPSYSVNFNVAGVDWVFAVWSNSGNGWVVKKDGSTSTKIFSGTLTSGQTAATQWNDLGLLIVDVVKGYYDWNITTANTLTNLSGTITFPANVTATYPLAIIGAGAGTPQITDAGGGTGATIGYSATLTLNSSGVPLGTNVTNGGSGYAVGDTIQFSSGTVQTNPLAPASQQNQPTVFNVTSVSSGAVTGLAVANPGYYAATVASGAQVPSSNTTTTSGAGTGCLITVNTINGWSATSPFVITLGSGYVTPVVKLKVNGVYVTVSPTAPFDIGTSGTLLGSAIAVYAGRVWVAQSRSISYTDINSYNSFGYAGGAFTINDAWLHKNINALFAANNYLYIWGDTSIDVLSGVTVSSTTGLTSFSRVNITASVGTAQPNSIFAYGQAVAFANTQGFWLLSGATPTKVSDDLDTLAQQINYAVPIYGGQVTVQNVLCTAWLFTFSDIFIQGTYGAPVTRQLLAIRFKNRWWFATQILAGNTLALGAMNEIPTGDQSLLYGWAGPTLYPIMQGTTLQSWIQQTKLWDFGAPILSKQAVLAGVGVFFNGSTSQGITATIDNENGRSITVSWKLPFVYVVWINNSNVIVPWTNNYGAQVQWTGTYQGYVFARAPANIGDSKYLGMTLRGGSNVLSLALNAIEYKKARRW